PRQTEDVRRARDAGGGAALDRRGADLGVAQHVKGDRETIHPLFEQRLDRLGRHVAARKTGAAGSDDGIDARIGDPSRADAAKRADPESHEFDIEIPRCAIAHLRFALTARPGMTPACYNEPALKVSQAFTVPC